VPCVLFHENFEIIRRRRRRPPPSTAAAPSSSDAGKARTVEQNDSPTAISQRVPREFGALHIAVSLPAHAFKASNCGCWMCRRQHKWGNCLKGARRGGEVSDVRVRPPFPTSTLHGVVLLGFCACIKWTIKARTEGSRRTAHVLIAFDSSIGYPPPPRPG